MAAQQVLQALAAHVEAAILAGNITPNVTRGPDHGQGEFNIFRAFVYTTNMQPPRAAYSPGLFTQTLVVQFLQPFVNVADPDPEVRLWGVVDTLLARLDGDDTLGGNAVRIEWGALDVTLEDGYSDGTRTATIAVPVLQQEVTL